MADLSTASRDAPSEPGVANDVGRAPSRRLLRVAGTLAALFTLAFGYLVSAAYEEPSPVDNVATAVIGHAPEWFVELGIQLFATNDKLALGIGIVVVVALLGAVLGSWGGSRRWPPLAAYAALTGVGLAAAADRPDASTASAVAILVGSGAVGVGVHLLLVASLRDRRGAADRPDAPSPDRRWFLGVASGVVVVGATSALWARALVRQVAVAARNAVGLPIAADPAPPVPPGASFDVPGITPIVTSNREFYRIDTAFTTPRIDPTQWTMSVTGLVDEPYSLTYDELLDLPMVERHVTIACVSNEVGGDLIGNAKWLGVPLVDVFDRARPQGSAEQVVGRSVDGFTAGFPIELVDDGRDALVAVAMNDEPLPFAHGFPARLIVEGVYGYVSATKWLETIELTTWDGFDGFWIPRGWSKLGPVKTQCRIDVPRTAAVPTGRTVVAGVAWAQHRGIAAVEVRVDEGPWVSAELADELTNGTWRQWRAEVDLTEGDHVIEARATDANGDVQPAERRPPAPDGATGYPRRRVDAVSA